MKLSRASLVLLIALGMAGCHNNGKTAADKGAQGDQALPKGVSTLKKLGIEDVKVGTGAPAKDGDLVNVQYEGKLTGGAMFDSNMEKTTPFCFIVGQHTVIKGWDQGLIGMKKGGERKLSIPPDLGYGEHGSPPKIPGNSDLYFTVKLLDVWPKDDSLVIRAKTLKAGTGVGAKIGDMLVIDYLAKVATGTVVDSSRARGAHFNLNLGAGSVIPVFDQGLVGMKVGEVRELRCGPDMAFGQMGTRAGGVPPNAIMTFSVTLVRNDGH